MATDAERREVAWRLRKGTGKGMPLILNVAFSAFEFTGCSERTLNADEAALKLADLIEPEPERTCQDVEGGNFFRCSKCGCELMRFADGWKPLYMGEVRYCPNCGARVVEEEK